MADLTSSNDGQQEMSKQVEAIAEAAAQHDSQIAQMLNLVPKAAALSTAASRAISFTKKTWVDDPTSGTPITAADMNRLEQAIVDLNTTLTSVQNSLSRVVVEGFTASVGSSTVECSATWVPATSEMMISAPVGGGGTSIPFSPSRGLYIGYVVVSAPSGWKFNASKSAIIVACARNGSAYVMAASILESSITVTMGSLDSSVDQPYSIMVRAQCTHS